MLSRPTSSLEAKAEIERRFFDLEVFGYTIEHIVSAPILQALLFKLPPRCIMLLADLQAAPENESGGTNALSAARRSLPDRRATAF